MNNLSLKGIVTYSKSLSKWIISLFGLSHEESNQLITLNQIESYLDETLADNTILNIVLDNESNLSTVSILGGN